jgi:uncharacterized membrane protein YbhN (UPF0104 family)
MTQVPPSSDGTAVRPRVTPAVPGRTERLARRAHAGAVSLRETARRWEAKAPRVIAVLRAVFYPCAIALVTFMGWRAAQDVDLADIHYVPLFMAFGAALVWWLTLAFGWAALLDDGRPWHAMSSWCRTQVARYLPGGIWAVAARATTVQGRVRDKLTAVTAENVLVLVVSLAVGGVWATVHDWRWGLLTVLVAAPLLASRWLERRTRITHRGIRRAAGSYAVGYTAYGLLGVLVQIAVSGVQSPTYPLYVAGASCVAWAAGLVVVFAPGGVGVREVVYVALLSGLYPRAELEAGAVTSRLVTIAAEVTVLALVAVSRRFREAAPDTPA